MRSRAQLGIAIATLVVMGVLAPAAVAKPSVRYPIELTASNLAPLEGSFYELWIVKGDDKHSGGSFNVAGDGSLVDGFGHPASFSSPIKPKKADLIVVTIEPLPDPDPGPSGIAILAGSPTKRGADLSFPIDLSGAAGSFILATPTDAIATNETAGVWFLDPSAGPGASLALPTLPDGWVFEGWGVTQGLPLTTGRFTSASGADLASPFSGPNPGPPFPGEDFLTNLPAGITPPVDLADGGSMIVITLEPDLGGVDPTGPGPFSIKPLVVQVVAGAAPHESISLVRDLSTVPSGHASF